MTTDVDRLLRIGAAADLIGATPDQLRQWADAGLIAYFRLPGKNRQRMFRRADLEAFLETHRREPAQGAA